jgi:copper chaperone
MLCQDGKVKVHDSGHCNRQEPSMNTQTFTVQGMTCGHCEKAVTTAIRALDPQAEVRIDRSQNKVDVTTSQPREAVAAAISEEGYAVT